jgi:hypothetical protein
MWVKKDDIEIHDWNGFPAVTEILTENDEPSYVLRERVLIVRQSNVAVGSMLCP